jgi:hypothetical protein
MEAIISSEMLVTTKKVIQQQNQEDHSPHFHHCKTSDLTFLCIFVFTVSPLSSTHDVCGVKEKFSQIFISNS